MREDVLEVLHLVRRAAVQVGAAREQPWPRLPRFSGLAARELREAQLHVVDAQVLGRPGVEMLERARRVLRLVRRAAHREARAAARDRDIERGLDLPQVGVQRAAQAREALVVDRIEADFHGLGAGHARP